MSDTVKTRSDLKTQALSILVGLDPSQTPDVEDLEAIDDFVDPLLAQLATDEIAYIADSEEIPVEYFLPIARLLANVAGPRFGSAMNEQAKQVDEAALRRLSRSAPTYEVMQGHYF